MQFYQGRLSVEQVASAPFPVVVEGTPLSLVASDFDLAANEQILVTDADERLLGFVKTAEVNRRTDTMGAERRRWFDMPIESLLPTRLEPDSRQLQFSQDASTRCTPVVENGSLIGLITEDDALISWNRVAPMLSRATADPVTGLPNRFGFERRLHEELNRARRVDSSVTVLLFDVDHFKDVNDQYGHTVGDVLLRTVGTTLTNSLRSYDYVARFGGDEFAAICFGCRPGEIVIPIQRIQDRIDSLQLENVETPLSLSIGAAVATSSAERWSPVTLIDAADECLYVAKDSGRHCAFYTELDSPDSPVCPTLTGCQTCEMTSAEAPSATC